MNYAEICIIKRDGKREDFSISKIKNAIGKAFHASGIDNEDKLIAEITMRVISNFVSPTISVEEIQDLVEKELMKVRPEVAKKYIIYREWRNTERDRKTQMKHIMDGIVAIDKNDVNLSNANMSSHTPAGQMMTFASEVTKDYTYKYLLPKKYAEAHQLGDIHIHDLDYYPTKTTTCIQYDLDDLFERGFRTKNGSIRTPQSIQSYATLATIIFQTNQNEQHGGQAIPAFDFFMAEGVRKTFRKHLKTLTEFYIEVEGKEPGTEALKKIEEKAYAMTRKDTHRRKGLSANKKRYASGHGRLYPQPEHHAFARGKSSRVQFHQLWNRHFSRRPHGHRGTAESYHRRPGYPWRSTSLPHTDIQG